MRNFHESTTRESPRHESLREDLPSLAAFAVVAEERSFTRAAAKLGVSQSALSHTMRGLERRLGLQLLARTTRSVAATPAGESLLEDLRPALDRIRCSLLAVRQQSARPSGRLRLATSKSAAMTVLLKKLPAFARAYPEITLEVTTSNEPVDLVAAGFDAGIQIGEFVQRDMVAVRLGTELRLAVVGSPQYFAEHPAPKTPRDLKDHRCIGFRFPSGMYRWEFERRQKAVTVYPEGPVSFDDPDMVQQAVLAGMGLGMTMEHTIGPMLADGRMVQVMRDWCPSFPGYFLYYPSRRHQPAALTALIRALRER